jgi:hypothetical protein
MSNISKGRNSYDSTSTDLTIAFFNRNISPYPTEAGGAKFDLVPVTKQKDIMLNVARLHAQQEYDRIMQLVEVLQKQAADIKRRLEITDAVHAAEYQFQLAHGHTYWLLYDTRKQVTRLSHTGPDEWCTGKPEEYEYITKVKWLGDHTWMEVNDDKE